MFPYLNTFILGFVITLPSQHMFSFYHWTTVILLLTSCIVLAHDTKYLSFEVDFECGISYMSMVAINITLSVEEY